MAVNFQSEDWKHVKAECELDLKKYRELMEQPNKTWREKTIANGQILALKKILNLPQINSDLAAKGK